MSKIWLYRASKERKQKLTTEATKNIKQRIKYWS